MNPTGVGLNWTSKESLIADLNLIIFVLELSLAGQHFSSYYRYYFSQIFLQWNFLTLSQIIVMFTRFIFGKTGNKVRKEQEIHEYGIFVDPLSLTDGNISELVWKSKLKLSQARLASKNKDSAIDNVYKENVV